MVNALKQFVRIQAGGKLELINSDLPEGVDAEVIVRLPDGAPARTDSWGAMADESDTSDQIATDAMAARERPLRATRG